MRTLCALLTGLALATVAHAEDTEFWPEASLYKQLSETTRLYFDATYAKGKESPVASLDASAYMDFSIQPIYRPYLVSEDWQRNRYLWARLGYTRVSKTSLGTRELSEDRGVLALQARAPLPADVWLEGRARADLRWISGSYSTRYRFRGEISREFEVLRQMTVPYVRGEWMYDTRYDAHSRSLYEAGVETKLTRHFRVEAYLAWQYDYQPDKDSLRAFGLVAKWYY